MKTGAGLGFLCVVLFAWAAQAGSPVPDTGQTTCYDEAGTEIDCDGTGQDGEFSINPHSYTSLGGGTMVQDNVTGLIWEVKTDDGSIHDKDTTYTWSDASADFIAQLNDDVFGGYSDWRLPTIKELSNLVDAERSDPAIDTSYFPNTVSNRYWSSSSYAGNPGGAWGVDFSDGLVNDHGKGDSSRVRAVRGGQ